MEKPFTIHLITHSHVDVGYTDRQERIARYHSSFVEQAIECARTDSRPPDSTTGFKFTCESFWALEQYMHQHPSSGESKLVDALKSGRLELTAFYVHLADLLDRDSLSSSLDYAHRFSVKHSIPITCATAFDINGFPWAVVDELVDRGVKYLSTAINTHHGGAPFGRPLVPFYWEGRSGRKLLVWSGFPYHKANLLGLMPGFTPMVDPGIPGMFDATQHKTVFVDNIQYAEERVFKFVETLKSQGYPYGFVPIMGSGLFTDNSPVSLDYLDLIDEWNESHGDAIEIRTSTVREFFNKLEATDPDIPTYTGDWNDWWTDGTISTPAEVKLFRHAQRSKAIARTLDTEHVSKPEDEEKLNRELILFAEHTWGHSASHTDPHKLLVHQLEARKAKFATDADIRASELLDDVLRSQGEGEFIPTRPFKYRLLNPRKTAGPVIARVGVDFWEAGAVKQGFQVRDKVGRTYTAQVAESLRGTQLVFLTDLSERGATDIELQLDEQFETAELADFSVREEFENDFYKAVWNEQGIISLNYHSLAAGNLIPHGQSFGCPVYQIFRGADRRDAAGFGYDRRSKPRDEIIEGRPTKVTVLNSGPVFTRVCVDYDIEGTSHYRLIATFYAGIPRIEIAVEVSKDLVLDPEGLYARFPCIDDRAQWHIDKLGLMTLPGRDQLPQTCCDYYSVTNGAASINEQASFLFSTLDAPMITLGRIKLWDYTTDIEPSGSLYSWLTNNKWETNFRSHCAGLYEFRFVFDIGPGVADLHSIPDRLADNCMEVISIRR